MALQTELNGVFSNFSQNGPKDVVQTIEKSLADFKTSFDPKSTIQVGDALPPFTLPNAVGQEVSSADLLAKGPLLITFYRGEWCPFCNIALHHLQSNLPQFEAKGVTLVAISPELPNTSLTTTEKHALKFPVLSDVGNKFARQLGIVWKQPDSLRSVFAKFGNDLSKRNGDDSLEVPVPATFLVDQKGVVRNAFVDPDYMKRLEPETALEWIDKL